MKFSVKKFAAGVAAAMLCAASALAAKPLEGQKLKMAVSPTFPPFEFERLDEQGNARIVGYDIDMVDAIAAELGFTYELVHTNFKGLMGELASHRVDFVVSGMSPTEERRKTVDFSVPYYYCQTSIIQHKGANIKTVADLKGKRIAASFGTQYADFAEAAGAVVAAMDSSTYSMQELLAGRADVVISGLSDTEERRKSVDFSVPYYFCKTAIVSPAAAPLKNMAEMKGKKIATVFGTEYAKVVEASGSIPTLLDNSTMVTQELLNGRVDGAVMDASQAKTKCEQNGGYVYHVIPNEDLESAHYVSGAYSIAFRKGSGLIPLFNEQIGKMFASGRMNELIVKWMGEEFVK